jgi:hypothetical protein
MGDGIYATLAFDLASAVINILQIAISFRALYDRFADGGARSNEKIRFLIVGYMFWRTTVIRDLVIHLSLY